MKKKIIIAIDGFSSCGKSTVAKALAKELAYRFIDTGAMYRAVTLYMLQNKINATEIDEVKNALQKINIEFKFNSTTQKSDTYLNNFLVEEEIRTMKVAQNVSHFAAIKEVRLAMVAQQQEMGKNKAIVMDGRDIGSVVFPQAELKIFMTADPIVRAKRRLLELQANGTETTLDEVAANLKERDYIDSTRQESPLIQAEDARILDNTHLNFEEQLQVVLNWYNQIVAQ